LIDIGFLEDIEEELEEMNKGKRGRPYSYSDGLFIFLGYLYVFVRNYRILEGICRAFSKTFIKSKRVLYPIPHGGLLISD